MDEELAWVLENFYEYIINEIEGYIPIYKKLPTFAKKLGGRVLSSALNVLLDLNYEICKKYIP